jgi:uncharacterized membrane protein (UPF0127 family)
MNLSKNTCLGTKISVADSPRQRAVGLLGTTSLDPECGLLIFPTQAVHTFGMKYPLDLVFIDKKKVVVGTRRSIPPYRISRLYWRAECVLELPANTIENSRTELGDYLEWVEQS